MHGGCICWQFFSSSVHAASYQSSCLIAVSRPVALETVGEPRYRCAVLCHLTHATSLRHPDTLL